MDGLIIHVFWPFSGGLNSGSGPFLGPFWPLFELRSYVKSYVNYRKGTPVVKVNVTELFSLITVITDLVITRNYAALA